MIWLCLAIVLAISSFASRLQAELNQEALNSPPTLHPTSLSIIYSANSSKPTPPLKSPNFSPTEAQDHQSTFHTQESQTHADEYDDYDDYDRVIRTVHFFPHSHTDFGWQKGANRYMNDQVRNILSSMTHSLIQNPDRRFIWADFLYFSTFYFESSPEVRAKIDYLVKNNQLDLVNGAMTMNDVAVVKMDSFLHDFHHASQFIYQQFGKKVEYAWNIDPFGISSSEIALWSKMGYKWALFMRSTEVIKIPMMSTDPQSTGSQYIWKPHSKVDGGENALFLEFWNDYEAQILWFDEKWRDFPNHSVIDGNIWKYILFGDADVSTGVAEHIVKTGTIPATLINKDKNQIVDLIAHRLYDDIDLANYDPQIYIKGENRFMTVLFEIITRNDVLLKNGVTTRIDTFSLRKLLNMVLELRSMYDIMGSSTTVPKHPALQSFEKLSQAEQLRTTSTRLQAVTELSTSLYSTYLSLHPLIPHHFTLDHLSSSLRDRLITVYQNHFFEILTEVMSRTKSTSTLFHVSTPWGSDFMHVNSFVNQYGMEFFLDYMNNLQHYPPPSTLSNNNRGPSFRSSRSENVQSPAQHFQKCSEDADFVEINGRLHFSLFVCIHSKLGLIVRFEAPQLWKLVNTEGTDRNLTENIKNLAAMNNNQNRGQNQGYIKKLRPMRVALQYPLVEVVLKGRLSSNDEYFTAIQHEIQQSWIMHNDESMVKNDKKNQVVKNSRFQVLNQDGDDSSEDLSARDHTSDSQPPLPADITPATMIPANTTITAADISRNIAIHFANPQIRSLLPTSIFPFSLSPYHSTFHSHDHNIALDHYFPQIASKDSIETKTPTNPSDTIAISPFPYPIKTTRKIPLISTPTTRILQFHPLPSQALSSSNQPPTAQQRRNFNFFNFPSLPPQAHTSPSNSYNLPNLTGPAPRSTLASPLPLHPIVLPEFGLVNVLPNMDNWWGGLEDHRFWSGFYTTRPWVKQSERSVQSSLQAIEQLAAFAGSMDRVVGITDSDHTRKGSDAWRAENMKSFFIDNGRFIFNDMFTTSSLKLPATSPSANLNENRKNGPSAKPEGNISTQLNSLSQMYPYYTESDRQLVGTTTVLYGSNTNTDFDSNPSIHLISASQISQLSKSGNALSSLQSFRESKFFSPNRSPDSVDSQIDDFVGNSLGARGVNQFAPSLYPRKVFELTPNFTETITSKHKTELASNLTKTATPDAPIEPIAASKHTIEFTSQCSALTPFEQSHLSVIRQALSMLQHHDAITATSPLTTMADYYLQIERASESIDNLFSSYLSDLLNLPRYTAGSTELFLHEFNSILNEVKDTNGVDKKDHKLDPSSTILDELLTSLPNIDMSHAKNANEKTGESNAQPSSSSIRLLWSQPGSHSLIGSKCRYNYQTKTSTLQPALVPLILYNPTSKAIPAYTLKFSNLTTSDVVLLDAAANPIYSELISVLFDGPDPTGKASQTSSSSQFGSTVSTRDAMLQTGKTATSLLLSEHGPKPLDDVLGNIKHRGNRSGRLYGAEEVLLPPLPLLSSHDFLNSLPSSLLNLLDTPHTLVDLEEYVNQWRETDMKDNSLDKSKLLKLLTQSDLSKVSVGNSLYSKLQGFFNSLENVSPASSPLASIFSQSFQSRQESLWVDLNDPNQVNPGNADLTSFITKLIRSMVEPSFSTFQCPVVQSQINSLLLTHSEYSKPYFTSLMDAFTTIDTARLEQLLQDVGKFNPTQLQQLSKLVPFKDMTQYQHVASVLNHHFPYVVPKYNLYSAPIPLKPMEIKVLWLAINSKQGPCCTSANDYHNEPGLYTFQPQTELPGNQSQHSDSKNKPPQSTSFIQRFSRGSDITAKISTPPNHTMTRLCHFTIGAGIGMDQYCNLGSPFHPSWHAPVLLALPWEHHSVTPVSTSDPSQPETTSHNSSNNTSSSSLVSAGICHQSISNGRTTMTMTGSCGFSLDHTNVPIYTAGGTPSLLIQQSNLTHITHPHDVTFPTNSNNPNSSGAVHYNELPPTYIHSNLPDYYQYYPNAFLAASLDQHDPLNSQGGKSSSSSSQTNFLAPQPSPHSVPVVTPISIHLIKEHGADGSAQGHYTYGNDNSNLPTFPLIFNDLFDSAISALHSTNQPVFAQSSPLSDFYKLYQLYTGQTDLDLTIAALLNSLPLDKLKSLSQQFTINTLSTCTLFSPFDFAHFQDLALSNIANIGQTPVETASPGPSTHPVFNTFHNTLLVAISNENSVYRYGDVAPNHRYQVGAQPLPRAQSISLRPSKYQHTSQFHSLTPGALPEESPALGTRTTVFKGLVLELFSTRTWNHAKSPRFSPAELLAKLTLGKAWKSLLTQHAFESRTIDELMQNIRNTLRQVESATTPNALNTNTLFDSLCYCNSTSSPLGVITSSMSPHSGDFLFPECPCALPTPSPSPLTSQTPFQPQGAQTTSSSPLPTHLTQAQRHNRWTNSQHHTTYFSPPRPQYTHSYLQTFKIFRPTDGVQIGFILNLGQNEPQNVLMRIQSGVENSLSIDSSRQTDSMRHSIYVDDMGYNLVQKLYNRNNKANGNHFPYVTQCGIKDEYPSLVSTPAFQSFSLEKQSQSPTTAKVQNDLKPIYDPLLYSLSVPRGYDYVPNHVLATFMRPNHETPSIYPSSQLYGIRQLMLLPARAGGVTPSSQGTMDVMLGRRMQQGDSLGVAETLIDTNTVSFSALLIMHTNSISRDVGQIHSNQVNDVANHNAVDLRKIEAMQVQTHHIKHIAEFLLFNMVNTGKNDTSSSNSTTSNEQRTFSTQQVQAIVHNIVDKFLSSTTIRDHSKQARRNDIGLFNDVLGTNINSIYNWLFQPGSKPKHNTNPILSHLNPSITNLSSISHSNSLTLPQSIAQIKEIDSKLPQAYQYPLTTVGTGLIGVGVRGLLYNPVHFSYTPSYRTYYSESKANLIDSELFVKFSDKFNLSPAITSKLASTALHINESHTSITHFIRESVDKVGGLLPFLELHVQPGDVHYTSVLAYTFDKRDPSTGYTMYPDRKAKDRQSNSKINIPVKEQYFPFFPHQLTPNSETRSFRLAKYQPQVFGTILTVWTNGMMDVAMAKYRRARLGEASRDNSLTGQNVVMVQSDDLIPGNEHNTPRSSPQHNVETPSPLDFTPMSSQRFPTPASPHISIDDLLQHPIVQASDATKNQIEGILSQLSTLSPDSIKHLESLHPSHHTFANSTHFDSLKVQQQSDEVDLESLSSSPLDGHPFATTQVGPGPSSSPLDRRPFATAQQSNPYFDPSITLPYDFTTDFLQHTSPIHMASDAAIWLGYAAATKYSAWHSHSDPSLFPPTTVIKLLDGTSTRGMSRSFHKSFPNTLAQKQMIDLMEGFGIQSALFQPDSTAPLLAQDWFDLTGYGAYIAEDGDPLSSTHPKQQKGHSKQTNAKNPFATLKEDLSRFETRASSATMTIRGEIRPATRSNTFPTNLPANTPVSASIGQVTIEQHFVEFLSKFMYLQLGSDRYPTISHHNSPTNYNSPVKFDVEDKDFMTRLMQKAESRASTSKCLNNHMNFGQFRFICEDYNAVDRYVNTALASRNDHFPTPNNQQQNLNETAFMSTLPYFSSAHNFKQQHILYLFQHHFFESINQLQVATTFHESFTFTFLLNRLISDYNDKSSSNQLSSNDANTQISSPLTGFSEPDLINGLTSAPFSTNGFFFGTSTQSLCEDDNFRSYTHYLSNPTLSFLSHPVPIVIPAPPLKPVKIDHVTLRLLYHAFAQAGLNSMKHVLKEVVLNEVNGKQGNRTTGGTEHVYQHFNYAYFLPSMQSMNSSKSFPLIVPLTSYTPYLSTSVHAQSTKSTEHPQSDLNIMDKCAIIQSISPICNLHAPDFFRASMLPNGQADSVLHFDISSPKITLRDSQEKKTGEQTEQVKPTFPPSPSSALPIQLTIQSIQPKTLYTAPNGAKRTQGVQRPMPFLGYGLQSTRQTLDNAVLTHFLHNQLFTQLQSMCFVDGGKELIQHAVKSLLNTHQQHSDRELITGQYDGVSPMSSKAYLAMKIGTTEQYCPVPSPPIPKTLLNDEFITRYNALLEAIYDNDNIVQFLNPNPHLTPFPRTLDAYSLNIYDILVKTYIALFPDTFTDNLAAHIQTLQNQPLSISFDPQTTTVLAAFTPLPLTSIHGTALPFKQDNSINRDRDQIDQISVLLEDTQEKFSNLSKAFSSAGSSSTKSKKEMKGDCLTHSSFSTTNSRHSTSTMTPPPSPSSSTSSPPSQTIHPARIACPAMPSYQTAPSLNNVGQQSEILFTPRLFSDMYLYNTHHQSYYKTVGDGGQGENSSKPHISLAIPASFLATSADPQIHLHFDTFEQCTNALTMVSLSFNHDGRVISLESSLGQTIYSQIIPASTSTQTGEDPDASTENKKDSGHDSIFQQILLGDWLRATFGTYNPSQIDLSKHIIETDQTVDRLLAFTQEERLFKTVYARKLDRMTFNPFCYCTPAIGPDPDLTNQVFQQAKQGKSTESTTSIFETVTSAFDNASSSPITFIQHPLTNVFNPQNDPYLIPIRSNSSVQFNQSLFVKVRSFALHTFHTVLYTNTLFHHTRHLDQLHERDQSARQLASLDHVLNLDQSLTPNQSEQRMYPYCATRPDETFTHGAIRKESDHNPSTFFFSTTLHISTQSPIYPSPINTPLIDTNTSTIFHQFVELDFFNTPTTSLISQHTTSTLSHLNTSPLITPIHLVSGVDDVSIAPPTPTSRPPRPKTNPNDFNNDNPDFDSNSESIPPGNKPSTLSSFLNVLVLSLIGICFLILLAFNLFKQCHDKNSNTHSGGSISKTARYSQIANNHETDSDSVDNGVESNPNHNIFDETDADISDLDFPADHGQFNSLN